jgi:hypothetical protein
MANCTRGCLPTARRGSIIKGPSWGRKRAAAIYSLLGSAKLNGLDPEAYMTAVRRRIAAIRSIGSESCCHGTCSRRLRLRGRRHDCQNYLNRNRVHNR